MYPTMMQAYDSKPLRGRWSAAILGEMLLIAAGGLMTTSTPASFNLLALCIGSVGALVIMSAVLDPLLPTSNTTVTRALKLQMLLLGVISGGALAYIALVGS